jgi:DNA-binding IscR family transcriptional regulator
MFNEEGVSVTNSTRFSSAIHILCFLDFFKQERITSELLSMSVNTNPVVVRRITSLLKKAKLINTTPGINANISLVRPVKDITLLDVYRAVIQPSNDDLFVIHKNTNPSCPVGSHIPSLLEDTYTKIEQVLQDELASITVDTLVLDIMSKNTSTS